MLIPFENLPITTPVRGIIHIGAHECEERSGYMKYFNMGDTNVVWIDALCEKTQMMKKKYPMLRIYNECISKIDDETVSFMIANNFQSSSILNFKTHMTQHPGVYETKRISLQTKTLKTFYEENHISPTDLNFMNLDIQGAELMALEGAGDILNDIDYIYTEVNIDELYEGCCLLHEMDAHLSKYYFKRVLINMTKHGWGDAFYVKKF